MYIVCVCVFVVVLHVVTVQVGQRNRQIVASCALKEIFWCKVSVGYRWKVPFADKRLKANVRVCEHLARGERQGFLAT